MGLSRHQSLAASVLAVVAAAGLALATTASATDVNGTVSFQGNVVFATPISGITADMLVVSSGPGIDATGNGVHCDITSNASAPVAADASYPASGTLSVGISMTHGGPQPPDGDCLVQLQANGNDGADVSAHGTVTVAVSATNIGNNETVIAPDIPVRQSKTHAGLTKDCLTWFKKQVKLRGKCNANLWKLGGTDGSLKCKDAGLEPTGCDPVGYADLELQLSFGDMNQQTDAPSAQAIDLTVLSDEAKCEKFIGKAAANFIATRNKLVERNCVEPVSDSETCRDSQSNTAKKKLDVIDNCVTPTNQATDTGTGLVIPDVDDPCLTQCVTAGTIDHKCLKSCFNFELSTMSDNLVGDVPICGNGVLQDGEGCDDGNTVSGDCCSSTCGIEPAGSQTCGVGACQVMTAQCSMGSPVTCTPGSPSAEICNDGIDNDCDGLIDSADPDCP